MSAIGVTGRGWTMARRTWLPGALLLLAATAACARRPRVEQDAPAPARTAARRGDALLGDPSRVYQRMGLLAAGGALPFVGSVGYFATPSPDSTTVVTTLSLAASVLGFQRESERYRAAYTVGVHVRRRNDTTTVYAGDVQETVRVAGYRETTREDESIIAQRLFPLAPGEYVLAVTVTDVGSTRTARAELPLRVPRLAAPSLSTPILVLDVAPRESLDTLPRLVASPRATVVFGRDSVFPLYIEGYAASERFPLTMAVRSEQGATLWTDTVSLPRRGTMFSGIVRVPVSRVGLGVATFAAWPTGAADTASTPIFVSFGEELPVATFEEMLTYLRYFAPPERLTALRNAAPEARARAWVRFLEETDDNRVTPINEKLRDYFGRVRLANERFRDEGQAGWQTDRGMVFVSLGEPDQVYEQGAHEVSARGRAQIWEYRQYGVQLVFVDQTGFGRWRLTTGSEADFQSVLRRVQQQAP